MSHFAIGKEYTSEEISNYWDIKQKDTQRQKEIAKLVEKRESDKDKPFGFLTRGWPGLKHRLQSSTGLCTTEEFHILQIGITFID